MKTFSTRFISILITLFFSCHAYAGTSANDWIDEIKQQFINVAAVNIEDYQLCELYSKHDNKKEFVERVFPNNSMKGMKDIKWKEMKFHEEAAKSDLHFGREILHT